MYTKISGLWMRIQTCHSPAGFCVPLSLRHEKSRRYGRHASGTNLRLVRNHLTARQTELVKKEICKIFKKENLSITIEVNQKFTDFLDVTFDLSSNLFKAFMKATHSTSTEIVITHQQS